MDEEGQFDDCGAPRISCILEQHPEGSIIRLLEDGGLRLQREDWPYPQVADISLFRRCMARVEQAEEQGALKIELRHVATRLHAMKVLFTDCRASFTPENWSKVDLVAAHWSRPLTHRIVLSSESSTMISVKEEPTNLSTATVSTIKRK
ncbi:hypothetical protein AYO21_02578 [Fonsecaea monophora]|uniref:Uncharacterized protein n=1 Tax=Fonsecaea monophora TaxID=254056 RepID=A0A177FIT6_9EURO|nr:hypothetical protein AYO21_02578 [Fonsecaea monophora]OAG43292.1 hypothetical protein AYO21_02578 [Fonsecaea monophora]